MRPTFACAIAILAIASTSCTWVHMTQGASAVKVVSGPPAGCEKRGEVEVSVKDSVAFYDRNPLRVQEELETLARNEAPGLGADSCSILGELLGIDAASMDALREQRVVWWPREGEVYDRPSVV